MMEPESDPECTSMEGTPPPEELTPEVGGTVQEDCSDDQDLNPPDSKVPKMEHSDEVGSVPLKRPKNISSKNRKKWKQIKAKADSWMKATEPFSPSFVILYWQVSKGRHQLVWKGPRHMEAFATNTVVADTFKKVVLEQDYDLQKSSTATCKESKKLILPSIDPEDYVAVADLLYKVMPRIMNPKGIYGFYSNPNNIPDWFPEDLNFKSPNHPKRGEKKYTADEMRTILAAFIIKCSSLYQIDSAGTKGGNDSSDKDSFVDEDAPSSFRDLDAQSSLGDLDAQSSLGDLDAQGSSLGDEDAQSSFGDEDSLPASPEYPIINPHNSDDQSPIEERPVVNVEESELLLRVYAAVEGSANSLKPRRALALLRSCTGTGGDWTVLKQAVQAVKSAVDFGALNLIRVRTASEVPISLLDSRRQSRLRGKVDRNFCVGKSCGNGDCLYNSASVLLFGTQRHADLLRLACVCSGVDHFDHYCQMYVSQLKDVSEAQAFLSAVASSDKTFDDKPSNATIPVLVQYIFQKEIATTTVSGSYCGMLQIQMLSGAVGVGIQQHSEEDEEASLAQISVFPCCFQGAVDVIHIMWVKMMATSRDRNHIIPLLPKERGKPVVARVDPDISNKISEICVFKGAHQCVMKHLHGDTDLHWIQCSKCSSWYHCACVGVTGEILPTFHCCASIDDKVILQGGLLKDGTSFQLLFSDVRSLYPHKGISDQAIDFFVRQILPTAAAPCKPGTAILSTCVYESVKRVISNCGDLGDGFTSTVKATVGCQKSLKDKDMLVFPCKPRIGSGSDCLELWHWIVVAIVPASKMAYVCDSGGGAMEMFAQQTVEELGRFISYLLASELTLKPVFLKVAKQTDGYNCGIHAIHNLQILAKLSSDEVVGAFKSNKQIDSAQIRGLCLMSCYQLMRGDKVKFVSKDFF